MKIERWGWYSITVNVVFRLIHLNETDRTHDAYRQLLWFQSVIDPMAAGIGIRRFGNNFSGFISAMQNQLIGRIEFLHSHPE